MKKILSLIICFMLFAPICACSDNSGAGTFTLQYEAGENGKINGEKFQEVTDLEKDGIILKGEAVEAVPDEGYLFAGWSDGKYENPRRDRNIKSNICVSAKFVPKIKTFNYIYNCEINSAYDRQITLIYDELSDTRFCVPQRDNYTFEGWFLEAECKTKISDENGKLFYGYGLFYENTENLYAKWNGIKTASDDKIIYPVLMVFVDEVYATLQSNYKITPPPHRPYDIGIEYDVDIHYKMPLVERKICEEVVRRISKCLNELTETIIFEVDAYFTTKPLSEENFDSGADHQGLFEYSIFADNILEVGLIIPKYRSIITTFSMQDYANILHVAAGLGRSKHAGIYLEGILGGLLINDEELDEFFEEDYIVRNHDYLESLYTHEFAHTIEQSLPINFDYDYHNIESYYSGLGYTQLETVRLYFLNETIMDGQKVGVPSSFWKGEFEVIANYIAGIGGKLMVSDEGDFVTYMGSYAVVQSVPYGFTGNEVTAIPLSGYQFLRWSDGVSTPSRQDKHLISRLNATAIFSKIN